MASILKVDELQGIATAGDITVTSEGGAATQSLQQGLAKVWVNFDGTGTIATRDSLNVSGLTDNGTGDYIITFSNAFNNANYATSYGRSIDSSAYPGGGIVTANYITTSMRLIPQRNTSGVNVDTANTLANYNGDLA